MGKKAQVLLLKPLPKAGNAGDVVDVKIHFANQVLIPQGIAVYYDAQVKNQREAQMKKIEKNKQEQKAKLQEVINTLQSEGISYEKQATEEGKLYDSVSNKSLTNHLMTTYQLVVPTESFSLEEKIEMIGEFQVPFSYEGIEASIPVRITKKD